MTLVEFLSHAMEKHNVFYSPEQIERALLSRDGYEEVSIPKEGGGVRVLHIPGQELKIVQRSILKWLRKIFPNMVPWWSYVDCAFFHRKSDWFLQFDLKDAFGSVNISQVKKILILELEEEARINKVIPGYFDTKWIHPSNSALAIEQLADLILALTTYKGRLPQGAPTSPSLYHLALNFDPEKFWDDWGDDFPFAPRSAGGLWPSILKEIPRPFLATCYVDNICISGPRPIPPDIQEKVFQKFREAGFEVHKVRQTSFRQGAPMICGLRVVEVNEERKLALPQRTIKKWRGMLGRLRHEQDLLEHSLLKRKIQGFIGALKPIYGDALPNQLAKPLAQLKELGMKL